MFEWGNTFPTAEILFVDAALWLGGASGVSDDMPLRSGGACPAVVVFWANVLVKVIQYYRSIGILP